MTHVKIKKSLVIKTIATVKKDILTKILGILQTVTEPV